MAVHFLTKPISRCQTVQVCPCPRIASFVRDFVSQLCSLRAGLIELDHELNEW